MTSIAVSSSFRQSLDAAPGDEVIAVVEKTTWQRIVERLPVRDDDVEWYELSDIAPLLGIRTRQLRNHCRRLWPSHDSKSHWRLTHAQAVRLVRAVYWAGKKVP